jgi:hypothetical protein
MKGLDFNNFKVDFSNLVPDISALKFDVQPPVFDYEITPISETIENSMLPILNKNQDIIDTLKENCEELRNRH